MIKLQDIIFIDKVQFLKELLNEINPDNLEVVQEGDRYFLKRTDTYNNRPDEERKFEISENNYFKILLLQELIKLYKNDYNK